VLVAASLAVLSLLAFAVSVVALCEIRKGQGPERDPGRRRQRPSLRNFRFWEPGFRSEDCTCYAFEDVFSTVRASPLGKFING
jgi:hypothetical protein